MDQNESGVPLRLADQLIMTSDPRQAEYFRGYREGIQLHRLGGRNTEHFPYYKAYRESRAPYPDAYMRGVLDGCNGLKPESPSDLLPTFRAS